MAWLCIWLAAAGLAAAQRIGDALARRVTETVPAAVKDVRFDVPVTNGLALHLAADAIEGLRDGDRVAIWHDQSGAGRHAIQGTEAKQFAYVENVMNGKPVLRGDGAERDMTGSISITQPFMGFFVSRVNAESILFDGASRGLYVIKVWSATQVRLYSGQAMTTPSGFVSVGTPSVITTLSQGAGSKIWVNGGLAATANAGTAGLSSYRIGNDEGVYNRYFNGDLAELLVYNRALTDPERQAVEQYLGKKWLDW